MDDALIQNLPAPTQPSDLDGWTAEDMTGWLATSIRTTVAAEERTEEMRVACGLVLYQLRVELGDGDYGAALDGVAREAGVTARTLTTWRTKAEARFQLAPPSERTVARRARVDSGSLPKLTAPPAKRQPKALTVPPTGTDNGSGPSSDVAKPEPGTTECPRCHGSGRIEAPRLAQPTVALCTCAVPTLSKQASNICTACHRPRRR